MVDRRLLETLKTKTDSLSERWKDQIRNAPHLHAYNARSDAELLALNGPLFAALAGTLERGLDKNALGAFFVKLGKERMKNGYPLSETVFALNICRQVVIEHIETKSVADGTVTRDGAVCAHGTDDPVKLYRAIGVTSDIAEFFFMGLFYLTKGELEEVWEAMREAGDLTDAQLKKYFKDDFFFK